MNWPQGYRLIRLDEIDSTNSEARRLAEAGETGPVWITAVRQTAGRGRRGRAWDTASGNLAATLLLRAGQFRPTVLRGRTGGCRHGSAFRSPGASQCEMAQ